MEEKNLSEPANSNDGVGLTQDALPLHWGYFLLEMTRIRKILKNIILVLLGTIISLFVLSFQPWSRFTSAQWTISQVSFKKIIILIADKELFQTLTINDSHPLWSSTLSRNEIQFWFWFLKWKIKTDLSNFHLTHTVFIPLSASFHTLHSNISILNRYNRLISFGLFCWTAVVEILPGPITRPQSDGDVRKARECVDGTWLFFSRAKGPTWGDWRRKYCQKRTIEGRAMTFSRNDSPHSAYYLLIRVASDCDTWG